MKDENKCFFSISLKNGITITGQNPQQVLDYLDCTRYAMGVSCHAISSDRVDEPIAQNYLPKLRQIREYSFNALLTIQKNLRNKKG